VVVIVATGAAEAAAEIVTGGCDILFSKWGVSIAELTGDDTVSDTDIGIAAADDDDDNDGGIATDAEIASGPHSNVSEDAIGASSSSSANLKRILLDSSIIASSNVSHG
jgi:hypothetical protein